MDWIEKGYFLFRCSVESIVPAVEAFVQNGRHEAYIVLTPSNKFLFLKGLSAQEEEKTRGIQLRVIRFVSPDGKVSVLLTNLLNQSRFPKEESIEFCLRR